ncbi:MAG TPA: hypothetical protein VGZ00_09410 [Candidatus Baltobacteraceae bacterium]|jgi:hypothetical protein|nr:hypothetical protein [Candidatus Baltobacteraceae bacterium]
MKIITSVLALALIMAPAFGSADETPSPNSAPPQAEHMRHHPDAAAFRAFQEQSLHLRAQTRSAILSALTSEHRSLLSTTVGQLAVSTDPDPRAAARQFNQALSADERQAILRINENFKHRMLALRSTLRQQLASQAASQGATKDDWISHSEKSPRPHSSPNAGMIVLHEALGFGFAAEHMHPAGHMHQNEDMHPQ